MPARRGSMSKAANTAPQEVEETQPEEEVQEPEEVDEETEDELDEAEEYDSRKIDPQETLWDGGPNFAQINAWKDQYGEHNIYVTSLTPELHYVWRTLTRFEYRRLVKNLEQAVASGQTSQAQAGMDNEESMVELCVLFPTYRRTDQVNLPAGAASTLSEQIMDASGFNSLDVRKL